MENFSYLSLTWPLIQLRDKIIVLIVELHIPLRRYRVITDLNPKALFMFSTISPKNTIFFPGKKVDFTASEAFVSCDMER